jgi:hypothetical protein
MVTGRRPVIAISPKSPFTADASDTAVMLNVAS